MQDRTDFPIEDYERHMPRLRKRRDKAAAIATCGSLTAGLEVGLFALLPGHPGACLWATGALAVLSWISALVSRDASAQHDLIRRGGRPTGVWFKLIEESKGDPDLQNELHADMDHVVAVTERKALTDTESQWWRQEGSLWYETQQFINATQSVIETHEEAERQAAREERRRAYEKDIAEAKARLQKAETESRIAATQRWIDEQREWDAFKEDAQIDARERKERGDWYEPPMGVPGAIHEIPTPTQQRLIADAIKRDIERQLQAFSVPLWQGARSAVEREEVRAWGQVEPVAEYCSERHMKVYSEVQVRMVVAALPAQVKKHYRIYACGDHFHLTRTVR